MKCNNNSSGFPLSGIVSREALQKQWKAGSHGGTYGGNAVSCAAAVEVINVFKEENVCIFCCGEVFICYRFSKM